MYVVLIVLYLILIINVLKKIGFSDTDMSKHCRKRYPRLRNREDGFVNCEDHRCVCDNFRLFCRTIS